MCGWMATRTHASCPLQFAVLAILSVMVDDGLGAGRERYDP